MIIRTAGATALLLATTLMTACSSDESSTPTTSAAAAPSSSSVRPAGNTRGAIEVDLGTEVVAKGGFTVSNSALSSEGCSPNTEHPDVTKQLFKATIYTGPKISKEWLWQSEFYYVDSAGKITSQRATTDLTDCRGFIGVPADLPPNSSADAAITLDIPKSTKLIGYHSTLSGDDVRIEWRIPPQ